MALKTFSFAAGSKSISIGNEFLGTLPKHLLFAMLKNYAFHHFNLNNFVMYVYGPHVPSEGLSLNTTNTKTSTMAYQTLFSGLGINHATTNLQITLELSMKGYFMALFDLTPDHSASVEHTSWRITGT